MVVTAFVLPGSIVPILDRVRAILSERVLACSRNWHWDASDPNPLDHAEGCALCLDLREAIRLLNQAFPTKGGRPRRHVDMGRLSSLLSEGKSPKTAAREMKLGYGTVMRALGRERRRLETLPVLQLGP